MTDSPAALDLAREDPGHPEVVELLERHLEFVRSLSPPDAVYALDLEGLRRPEIRFWAARLGGRVVGCGALLHLDDEHVELKSMHTLAELRGRGIASALAQHLLAEAVRSGYRRMSLETGSSEHFAPAQRVYAQLGFEPCGPFADYPGHAHSFFMTRALGSRT